MSARLITTKILKQVIEDKMTLSHIFNNNSLIKQAENEKALIQEMSYGAIRWYIQLESLLNQLLDKPIKSKDSELKYLLIIGLYQLVHMRIAAHAVVSETVETCVKLKKQSAKGLVNAILRRYLRNADTLSSSFSNIETQTSHPQWLIEKLQNDWPEDWQKIIDANNQRPPMYLRVNQLQNNRDQYLKKLEDDEINAKPTPFSKQGILLDKPKDISQLPGFAKGLVSVQELAAQFSTHLLDLHAGQNVLDACAAPGGKSAHILETTPDIASLTVIEKDPKRAEKLSATLNRLKLDASLKVSDALDVDEWWSGEEYDRVLLDAPCSATGVIRRHPDIKVLRSADEVNKINKLQLALLSTLWKVLKKQGLLLYVTCSILKKENSDIIKLFLENNADCSIKPIEVEWGLDTDYGTQILTGENNMDGFFYACLQKQ